MSIKLVAVRVKTLKNNLLQGLLFTTLSCMLWFKTFGLNFIFLLFLDVVMYDEFETMENKM